MLALLVLFLSSERLEIRDGKLAGAAGYCIRLHALGPVERVTVVVNGLNAGELADADSELDITGYLSAGALNSIDTRPGGRVTGLWAWKSPLVYLARAREVRDGLIEITIVNTTENTAQVEVEEQQFTVSPGTRLSKMMAGALRVVHMRAVSDGLDREFVDEAVVEPHVTRPGRPAARP